ncbi:efflux RND transporter periplasmic adaptor subunit [Pacificibacter marinus]|uniref:efflux RND transporter periplasmic adaptor subunit n=1 Tax=Pacificibacter marinus TaxID=658057 RepID=UPI001C06B703|nr:efflux transporter periplasmic adaptor subunit [Pacificibacter marinus]MBU2867716.1 efflux transporter periplasmic adaptor subunit [Pacificibacter marinus]
MKFLRRSLFGLFLISVCAALVFGAGYNMYASIREKAAQEGFRPPARERQFSVNAVRVKPTQIAPVLSTFGEVLARRTLELRAPQGGEVIELAETFQEGGAVKAGDVLLRVDPTDAESNLRVAQADFQEAEAELNDAERGLDIAEDDLAAAQGQLDLRVTALARQRNLADRGVGTESSVETAALSEAAARQSVLSKRQSLAAAVARVDQSKNGVLRAQINVAEAERALENTQVIAAFDGTLSDVSVALGAILNDNEQIGTLIDPSDLEIAFRVSTQQYANLTSQSGSLSNLPIEASLSMADLELTAKGRISRESAVVGSGQTGRQLFASLETSLGLRPGDFVTVRIEEPVLRDVALIPSAAVDAANTVLALTPDSRLEVLSAPILRRQGDNVIVAARAIAGRQIVSERSPLLGAGIRVKVIGAEMPERGDASPDDVTSTDTPTDDSDTVALTDDRRAKLLAFVESNTGMPAEVRDRMAEQLKADEVPLALVTRLESRMGG